MKEEQKTREYLNTLLHTSLEVQEIQRGDWMDCMRV
jgi:hypothetical protein